MDHPDHSAYVQALTMLARREFSEAAMRERLARRGHATGAIDVAIARLKQERALDDARVAETIARVQSGHKGRGRLRARRQIEMAGVPSSIARRAVDEVFGALDENELLEAALTKRLRGRERIEHDREFQRLYRHLVGQGFESGCVMKVLAARRHPQ